MKRYKKGEHIVASNMIFEIHGSYQWRDNSGNDIYHYDLMCVVSNGFDPLAHDGLYKNRNLNNMGIDVEKTTKLNRMIKLSSLGV